VYIWGRFVRLLATRRRRGRLEAPFGVSRLTLRVWPGDVDPYLHINNGRYLAIADLGRHDLFLRMRLHRAARRLGLAPVMGGSAIVFRREIRLWRRFELVSRFVTWEGTRLVGEHVFLLPGTAGGAPEPAALVLNTVGFYGRAERRFAEVATVFEEVRAGLARPAPQGEVRAFLDAQEALRRAALGADARSSVARL